MAGARSGDVIGSDKVVGSAIFDADGKCVGFVDRIILEKDSGRVRCAVIALFSTDRHVRSYQPLPWNMLDYDERVGGFHLDIA